MTNFENQITEFQSLVSQLKLYMDSSKCSSEVAKETEPEETLSNIKYQNQYFNNQQNCKDMNFNNEVWIKSSLDTNKDFYLYDKCNLPLSEGIINSNFGSKRTKHINLLESNTLKENLVPHYAQVKEDNINENIHGYSDCCENKNSKVEDNASNVSLAQLKSKLRLLEIQIVNTETTENK